MKALFNCSIIKNVFLRLDSSFIELEITYLDTQEKTWVSRRKINGMKDREFNKQVYEKVYSTIKEALLNKNPFVEIEL